MLGHVGHATIRGLVPKDCADMQHQPSVINFLWQVALSLAFRCLAEDGQPICILVSVSPKQAAGMIMTDVQVRIGTSFWGVERHNVSIRRAMGKGAEYYGGPCSNVA